MRGAQLPLVLGFAALAGGCISAIQPSLQPLVLDDDAVAVPEITGRWVEVAEEDDTDDDRNKAPILTFRAAGKAEYELAAGTRGDDSPGVLIVRFGRLGGELFWDATPRPPRDELGLWSNHLQPVHGFARVRVRDDRLEIALLDAGFVERASRQGLLEIAHEQAKDGILLTARTSDLRLWLGDLALDDEAFGDTLVLERMPEEEGPRPGSH
jgi:hypothetical protein